jgi:glycosyltransferase involved in cell wall biosynthesis
MRILHIMASRDNGGAETYSTDLMLSLHEAGVDQCVVMRETALRATTLAVAGLRVDTRVLRSPIHAFRRFQLRRLIAREKPDIIHCWMRRAASLAQGVDTSRTALIGWFGDYEDIKHFAHCTHLVGVTKDLVAHMQGNGVPEAQTFYIPTFPTIEDAPAVDRAALDTPEDATVLLALSRLHPVKGLDTLLQAIKDVPQCHLWLAGEGPIRKDLEDLAGKLGIEARVRFLGWRNDRGALLRAADVCVLPSRYEPFGTVILEAWASRTPLVACASAGPAAYVVDGENGALAPIDDAPALASAIRRVIEDGALRERIVTRGYEDYHISYTREAVTRQWIEYYRSLRNMPAITATRGKPLARSALEATIEKVDHA